LSRSSKDKKDSEKGDDESIDSMSSIDATIVVQLALSYSSGPSECNPYSHNPDTASRFW